jgi:hypothetical protein
MTFKKSQLEFPGLNEPYNESLNWKAKFIARNPLEIKIEFGLNL